MWYYQNNIIDSVDAMPEGVSGFIYIKNNFNIFIINNNYVGI